MEVTHAAPPAESPPDKQWPGVPLAYEFVRPSYELMARRYELIEGRIRALITLTATLTLAAPVFVRSIRETVTFGSPWFILALVAAVAVVALGVTATVRWSIRLYSPNRIYEEALHWGAWEFQKNLLAWAADAFEENARSVRMKARLTDAMSVILLAEVVLLGAWAFAPV